MKKSNLLYISFIGLSLIATTITGCNSGSTPSQSSNKSTIVKSIANYDTLLTKLKQTRYQINGVTIDENRVNIEKLAKWFTSVSQYKFQDSENIDIINFQDARPLRNDLYISIASNNIWYNGVENVPQTTYASDNISVNDLDSILSQ